MRKVIQLTAMPGYCVGRAERVVEPTLYALCDDGSVWAMDGNHSRWLSISTKSIREGHERNSPHHSMCLCDECANPASAAVPEPEKEIGIPMTQLEKIAGHLSQYDMGDPDPLQDNAADDIRYLLERVATLTKDAELLDKLERRRVAKIYFMAANEEFAPRGQALRAALRDMPDACGTNGCALPENHGGVWHDDGNACWPDLASPQEQGERP